MKSIYPVILAGGSGTRLWPLSRKSYPKQFSNFVGDLSLFQQSALRLTSFDTIKFAPHIVLTNDDYRFTVSDQLKALNLNAENILIEPYAKNTAPAIAVASLCAYSQDRDAILLVAPSDHLIPENEVFHSAIKVGLSHTSEEKLVTFGITPTRPETGFGYLRICKSGGPNKGAYEVLQFIEKPNHTTAMKMIKTKSFLWNSGIFLFKAADMINAFKKYSPDTFHLAQDALNTSEKDLGFVRLNSKPWKKIGAKSIDYTIMEKANNLMAVPYTSQWSDLGDWSSVWRDTEKDTLGNVVSNSAHAIDCSNSLLRAESKSQQLVGLGLDNIVAIAMPDAVLIANKDKAQDVKKVVTHLEEGNILQSKTFPKDYRPWGWFESLAIGDVFQVKRIFVKAGAALSLQSHQHRSEHWVVVQGTAEVTIGDKVMQLKEGQSVFVPLGARHRLANNEKIPLQIIEVQIGSYLGEDDIIRYEDLYSRI